MTDIIVFSKDRPLQLYNSLESILKFAKGYNKIYILFNYTTDDYLESYHKLNNLKMFSEVVFVNEKEYGFKESFVSLLDMLEGEHLLMEIDDAFYCDELDLEKYSILFQNPDCGRINFTADYKIYKQDYYVDHGDYLIVDREAILKLPQTNETLCLHYPFNVSSTLHKAIDVSRLMQTEDIKNPFELEWKGSASPIFTKYKYNILIKTKGPIVRQLHINNFLNRYEEYYTLEDLHNIFKNGFVFDINFSMLKDSKQTTDWFKDVAKDNRFPIFPWDINPADYKQILSKHKRYKND